MESARGKMSIAVPYFDAGGIYGHLAFERLADILNNC
jgi:hypothetical protein